MGVDYFWKRVPAAVAADGDPKVLSDLVPHWFDDEFTTDQAAGLLVGAEDTGALIATLLRLRATDPTSTAAARAFAADPDDWDDDWMVGTLSPATVRQVADFVAGVHLNSLSPPDRDALAADAARMGYRRPFDESWADEVLNDTREVAALLQAAATAGEAVILKISA